MKKNYLNLILLAIVFSNNAFSINEKTAPIHFSDIQYQN